MFMGMRARERGEVEKARKDDDGKNGRRGGVFMGREEGERRRQLNPRVVHVLPMVRLKMAPGARFSSPLPIDPITGGRSGGDEDGRSDGVRSTRRIHVVVTGASRAAETRDRVASFPSGGMDRGTSSWIHVIQKY